MQQANVRQCSYFELALPVDLHAEIQDNKGPDLIINFTEYYGEVGGGGEPITVTPCSTIFGVSQTWCTEKFFCESWSEVPSVKRKLPKSSIVYTYMEDQLKKKKNVNLAKRP